MTASGRKDLDGKVALVTGGGTGIGSAVARRLVDRGALVAVAGRRAAPLDEVAARTGAMPIPCDVADASSVDAAIDHVVRRLGGLDIVVNNAGIVHRGGVEQVDDVGWSSVIDVNLTGPARICRAAVPHLRARGGGAIVNVSSIGGLFAARESIAYSTTKAALFGLTRSMALDLGPSGIRVNTLCPGWVDTPMADGAIRRVAQVHGVSMEAARDILVRHNPIRRLADPDEIAKCIEFLATDDSSFVTGTVLIADGGQSIVDLGTLPMVGP
jgi:NAD(P)-dependent dehydrogenase (short-subunit alcohol dehydrogenase family)